MGKLRQRLHHASENPRHSLNCVLTGTASAFAGLMLVLGAEKLMPSSFEQELIALFGLLTIGAGGILTLKGYFGLSILRLFRFIDDQRH